MALDSFSHLKLLEASLGFPSSTRLQSLRNPYDVIALFTHACMLSVGCHLIGLGEDDRLDTPIDASTNLRPLPERWNLGDPYSFLYINSQSPVEILLKISRLGNRVFFFGLGVGGDEKTTSFDIVTKDFVSDSFFPFTPKSGEDDAGSGGPGKKLQDGFISESRMIDLANLVKNNLIQILIPGLSDLGYQEGTPTVGSFESIQRTQGLAGGEAEFNDPLQGGFHPPRPFHAHQSPIPSRETPPGFEDEHQILCPPRQSPLPLDRNPLSIGEDDLNPPGLGPCPSLRGPLFGEGGIRQPGLGSGPMSGMHPTRDHPIFGAGNTSGGQGDHDPGCPPGARYDPVGAGDAGGSGGADFI